MTLVSILSSLGVSFEEGLAIFKGDGWFTNKTNNSAPRFANVLTGNTSKVPEPGFTQVDTDAINSMPTRSQLTPSYLEEHPGLLAGFVFSIKLNMNALSSFRKIIAFLRKYDINLSTLTPIQKMFISHLAWFFATGGDVPTWDKVNYDPLVKAILSIGGEKLALPIIEDVLHFNTPYFIAFESVFNSTDNNTIKDGLRLDAERFEFFLPLS